jgi:hypothetical protein
VNILVNSIDENCRKNLKQKNTTVKCCIHFIALQIHTRCIRRNLPYFRRLFPRLIHINITTHAYQKLNGYRDNSVIKRWSPCGSTYCTCLTWCVMRTLRRSVLELIAKLPRCVCCVKCLESYANFYETSASLYVIQMLSTGVNTVATTNSSL